MNFSRTILSKFKPQPMRIIVQKESSLSPATGQFPNRNSSDKQEANLRKQEGSYINGRKAQRIPIMRRIISNFKANNDSLQSNCILNSQIMIGNSMEELVGALCKNFKDPATGKVHANSFLMVLNSQGVLDEFLLKQLQRTLPKHIQDQYIEEDKLIQQFCKPNIHDYREQDYQQIYDFLKGDNPTLNIDKIFESQKQKQDFKNKFHKQTIDKNQLRSILSAIVPQVFEFASKTNQNHHGMHRIKDNLSNSMKGSEHSSY